MGDGLELLPLLFTNSGKPYLCYKCEDGVVYRDNEGKGICIECGKTCLHNMASANAGVLVKVRK
jgi:hypothetical protein